MTLRRVLVLIKALPADSLFWRSVHAAAKKAEIPTSERIRDRQEHYRNQARATQARAAQTKRSTTR